MADLTHIDAWVFDLDNTLYPAECRLFAQIDVRIADFIKDTLHISLDDARRMQRDYYVRYGASMTGLMHEHGVSPDVYLDYVHEIELDAVVENPALAETLADLPGRRLILTNASERHAANVTAKIGIDHLFDGVFDIKAAEYTPKPNRETYERFLARHAVRADSAVIFDDIAHNLEAPHALGMTTVLVCSDAAWLADEPDGKRPARRGESAAHVHHATADLTDFLSRVKTAARI